ncbi:ADP-ribosyltransferase [Nocardia sp. NPDC127526]|uniref:WXG100-like domain-containing protein n=1 Tax=Nocardia sp. NPDC127526 TaxID=3345393 RepID=UPI00363EBFB7
MALEFPSWLEWLEWVVGSDWPHGNEDLMWQMGRDLETVAKRVDNLIDDLGTLINGVSDALPEGAGGEGILSWLVPLRDGNGDGKNGSLADFADNYRSLAKAADGMGDQLQSAKLNFYIAGAWLVAEMAWAAASGPAAPAAEAGVLAAGRILFKKLGEKLALRIGGVVGKFITDPVLKKIVTKLVYEITQEAVVETFQGTSQELLVQTIQKSQGHIDSYDWKAVGTNAAISAFAGGVGGGTGLGVGNLLPTTAGRLKGITNGAITGATAGAAGAGAAWLGSGVLTGNWEFDPRSLTGGALSGAGPSAIYGAKGMSDLNGNPGGMPDPTGTSTTGTPGDGDSGAPGNASPDGSTDNPNSGTDPAGNQQTNGAQPSPAGTTDSDTGTGGDTNTGTDTTTGGNTDATAPTNGNESTSPNDSDVGSRNGEQSSEPRAGDPNSPSDKPTDSEQRAGESPSTTDESAPNGRDTSNQPKVANSETNTNLTESANTSQAAQSNTATTGGTQSGGVAQSAPNVSGAGSPSANTTTATSAPNTSTTLPTSSSTTNVANTSTAASSSTASNSSTAGETRASTPSDPKVGPARATQLDGTAPRPVAGLPSSPGPQISAARAAVGEPGVDPGNTTAPMQATRTGVEVPDAKQQESKSNSATDPVAAVVPVMPVGANSSPDSRTQTSNRTRPPTGPSAPPGSRMGTEQGPTNAGKPTAPTQSSATTSDVDTAGSPSNASPAPHVDDPQTPTRIDQSELDLVPADQTYGSQDPLVPPWLDNGPSEPTPRRSLARRIIDALLGRSNVDSDARTADTHNADTRTAPPDNDAPPARIPAEQQSLPHEPRSPQLTPHQQNLVDEYAHTNNRSVADVMADIKAARLTVDDTGVHVVTPDHVGPATRVDRSYLDTLLRQKIGAHGQRFDSLNPDQFEPGCPDEELPGHLTREMPDGALNRATVPVDPKQIDLSYPDDEYDVVWRDRSEASAFLRPDNALFRLDSRGPEIFETGFQPRNPKHFNIAAHTGQTTDSGFVSTSKSPEHATVRELGHLRTEMQTNSLRRLPDGNFVQTRYVHELYTPHGIDVDATINDARAHNPMMWAHGHTEAEVLLPGGVRSDQIYRIWPREVIVSPSGEILDTRIGDPIVNPRFAYADNPTFHYTHNPEQSARTPENTGPTTHPEGDVLPNTDDPASVSRPPTGIDPAQRVPRDPATPGNPSGHSPTTAHLPQNQQAQQPTTEQNPVNPSLPTDPTAPQKLFESPWATPDTAPTRTTPPQQGQPLPAQQQPTTHTPSHPDNTAPVSSAPANPAAPTQSAPHPNQPTPAHQSPVNPQANQPAPAHQPPVNQQTTHHPPQQAPGKPPKPNGWPGKNIHNVDTARKNLKKWVRLINGPGVMFAGRNINCVLCSDSFLRTWFGRPTEAPALNDPSKPQGLGPQAVDNLTGGTREPTTFQRIKDQLLHLGPGSAAMVLTDWVDANGKRVGGHAYVAVNHNGKVLFVDPQTGEVHGWPPRFRPDGVGATQAVFLTPDGKPLRPLAAQPNTPAPQQHQPQIPAQPPTLTPSLRSRFEQMRTVITELAKAFHTPTRAHEIPYLQTQLGAHLNSLGLSNPAANQTPWQLLAQHDPALAEYLAKYQHDLLANTNTNQDPTAFGTPEPDANTPEGDPAPPNSETPGSPSSDQNAAGQPSTDQAGTTNDSVDEVIGSENDSTVDHAPANPLDDLNFPHPWTVRQDLTALTPAEFAELRSYAVGGYKAVNDALRGKGPMTEDIAERIELLRSALSKVSLNTTYRVSRSTEATDLGFTTSAEIDESLIGEWLTEPAFMSTAGFKDPPYLFKRQDPVILDIIVPEGTPAIAFDEAITESDMVMKERELLLADGLELQVFNVHYDTEQGVWRIQAVVAAPAINEGAVDERAERRSATDAPDQSLARANDPATPRDGEGARPEAGTVPSGDRGVQGGRERTPDGVNPPNSDTGNQDGTTEDGPVDSDTTDQPAKQLTHDHTTAPLTNDAKPIADLNEHPGEVKVENELITEINGRPVEEHVDTMALDRANQFRAANKEFSQQPGEDPRKTQKRVKKAQQDGSYVGPRWHGEVSAVVLDRRTGIAYEGTNGDGRNALDEESIHPTLQQNIDAMERAGGYPDLNRFGDPEDPDNPNATRPHPHFDDPYGHAEVKAANEALWARERENERRLTEGRTDLLPTGPEALAELYSQTYKPFVKNGPVATPYCANCNHTMGDAPNHSGRYTGFPPDSSNLVDRYTTPVEESLAPETSNPEQNNETQDQGSASPDQDAPPLPQVRHGADRTAIGTGPDIDRVYQNLRNEGAHDVILHTDQYGRPIDSNGNPLTVEQVIEAVRNNPDYKPGTPIRLISCHSGSDIGWAQQIADAFNTAVLAPTDIVGVRNAPNSEATVNNDTPWRIFQPTQKDGTTPQPATWMPDVQPDGPLPTDARNQDDWDTLGKTRGPDGKPYRGDQPIQNPRSDWYQDMRAAAREADARDPDLVKPADPGKYEPPSRPEVPRSDDPDSARKFAEVQRQIDPPPNHRADRDHIDNRVVPETTQEAYRNPLEPLVPEVDHREPPNESLFRGEDGRLHMEGDPPNSWRDYEADERKEIGHPNRHHLHKDGDTVGTWQQWMGKDRYQLRGEEGLAPDPKTNDKVDVKAQHERSEPHTVWNEKTAEEIAKTSKERIEKGEERNEVGKVVKDLMGEFHIESIHDLKKSELNGLIRQLEARIDDDLSKNLIDQKTADELYAKLDLLQEGAIRYNELGPELVDLSKVMAEHGGRDWGTDPTKWPGAVVLSPYTGEIDGKPTFDGSGTFDIIVAVPASEVTGGRTLILLIECKGVGSEKGSASTSEHGQVQQMTPEYKVRTAAMDENLKRILRELPERMIERGIDPESTEGKDLIKVRDEILQAHSEGKLHDEYVLAHASINGDITISHYSQDRDGLRVPILDLAGFVRPPATVQEVALALEQNLVREIDETRERIREGLDERGRELLDRAIEQYREGHTPAADMADLQAKLNASIELLQSPDAQELSLEERSRELSAAAENLAKLKSLELERGAELLHASNPDINPSLAKEILGPEILDSHRAATAYLDAATRDLVREAADIAREYRIQDRAGRELFIGYTLGRVQELEGALAKGKDVDLAQLQRDYERVQGAIAFERAQEAHALEALGLHPDHAQLARDVLEAERDRTFNRASDVFSREIVRQAEARVLEAREPIAKERERVIEKAQERVRELELARAQGKDLELARVQSEYTEVTKQIAKDRERDGRVIDSLGLAREHAEMVTRALDTRHAEPLTKAREALTAEVSRQATARVIEARGQDTREREQFIQRALEHARVMEGIVAQGQTPNLETVRSGYAEIVQEIERERKNDARALEQLGLAREHEHMVMGMLNTERAETLGKALEPYARELDRQQPNRALDPREIAARAVDTRGLDARGQDGRGLDPRPDESRTQPQTPRNSTLERQRELAADLARRGLSPELIAVRLTLELGQAQSAAEAVRARVTEAELTRTRAREMESRGIARER